MEKLKVLEEMLIGEPTHLDLKHRLKSISTIKEFNALLDEAMLVEEDKLILKAIYIKGRDFRYIADELGYSESTIKRRHKNAITKLVEKK